MKYVLILGSSHFLAPKYFLLAKEHILSKNINILAESKIYKSVGIHVIRHTIFYNCALAISCYLAPLTLLRECKSIEYALGRIRPYKNAPRTIDIDLFYSLSFKYNHPILKLPHKEGFSREFFVKPSLEVLKNLGWPIYLATKPMSFYTGSE